MDDIKKDSLTGGVTPTGEFHDADYTAAFGTGEELAKVFSDEPLTPAAPAEPEAAPAADGEAPAAEEKEEKEAEKKAASVRKGRPKRKKGYGLLGIPHILATVLWLGLAVALGVSLGRVAWVCAADVLAFGREEQIVTVSIDETDTLEDISLKLKDAGLIRYTWLFEAYGILTDAREDISAGTFSLNTIYDYHALVGNMSTYSSAREEVKVTIPEGYTCAQIFALLEDKGVCKAEYLEEYAANGELDDYWFLEGVERGDKYCLEGFLFPDTYNFYVNDNAENVLEKMLDDFDYRFSDEHIAALDTLNVKLAVMLEANGYDQDYIDSQKMDIRRLVTVASLIEKETANNDESYTIASVIYNRLTNQREYPYLNIDAALLYALGHRDVISAEDKLMDTPYNTYLYKGLIPGPISNPGLNSLNAALNPDNTNYHYYVLDTTAETRQHHFSDTYEEHMEFIASLEGSDG